MRRAVLILLCLLPLALAGCGGDDNDSSSGTTTEASGTTTTATTTEGTSSTVGCVDAEAPKAGARDGTKDYDALDSSKVYEVTMKTNCGSFTIVLDPAQSPNATASFVSLVKQGYFDNTVFHRILPGFVIQGGDPTATGSGGPGYSTVDTPPTDAAYKHGVVAMAKTGAEPPGTAGSQFFVVTAEEAQLTPDYAIIGTVTEGLPVVDAIGQFGPANDPTGAGAPTKVIVIEKATVAGP